MCVFERERYKERLSTCMSESGHCSRKSDPNPGHPENIHATAVWQTVCCHHEGSSSLCLCVCLPKLNNIKMLYISAIAHVIKYIVLSHNATFQFSVYPHPSTHEQYGCFSVLPVTCLEYYRALSNWGDNAWFHRAEQIMLYHAAPVLTPDRQAGMRSRDGVIKVNRDC